MSPDASFAAFVRANSSTLFRTAYLLTGDSGRAEDLVQDTLTRLYPKWALVEAADNQVAYVRRALTNGFLSERRRPASRDIPLWELPDRAAAADVARDVVDRHLLWSLVGELPERQRAAIVLRYFHDLPDDEIAESLGCRAATVRSLLSRAVAAMHRAAQRGRPADDQQEVGQ